jgi:hypothetical protein
MYDNPYQYHGPLDPNDKRLVFNYRKNDVDHIIQGIIRGDYWMILGPRQIGKTTFLHLVKKEFKQADFIYLDFQVAYSSEKKFYQYLIDQFLKEIPCKEIESKAIETDSPAMSFFNFLLNFKPEKENKIILLCDEIDGFDFRRSFLHLWRKVFNERIGKKELSRYAVITTGSVELVKLSSGRTSPFNIAKTFYIKDFSEEESKKIIEEPFAQLNIEIEPKAKQELLSKIFGHPQLLQHACHILVEKANAPGGTITKNLVNKAIGHLLSENSILKTLKEDIANDEVLKNLLHDLLIEEKEKDFPPFSDYAILGSGAIKEENSLCKIRNPIYKRFIKYILENPLKAPGIEKDGYHEPMKAKTDEKGQPIASMHFEKEGPRKKRKNMIKFLIAAIGILAIILLVAAIVEEDSLAKFWLIFGSGISASVAVGGLISLSSGEKNESSTKNN